MSSSMQLVDMVQDLRVGSVYEMDTKLAEDFLLKYNCNDGVTYKCHVCTDGYNNQIYCANDITSVLPKSSRARTSGIPINEFNVLVNKIKSKAELFSQLEYLIRNLSIQHIKKCDINLIIKNIEYCVAMKTPVGVYGSTLVMDDHTPLAMLGYVAQMFTKYQYVLIVSTINTAIVSHLFVSLCHEAGLNNIRVFFVEAVEYGLKLPTFFGSDVILNNGLPVFGHCCTGVITGKSDLDSAVDAFVNSTTMGPWKLRRVLIQESVYKHFQRVISWKCKNLISSGDNISNEQIKVLKDKCADVHIYNKKVFLIDYAGNPSDINSQDKSYQFVLVEAYRTVKELLSLLNKYGTYSLSLWCSDITEANEIAYEVKAAVVWINDHGVIEGPPKTSQAFYAQIDLEYKLRILQSCKTCLAKFDKIRGQLNKTNEFKLKEALKVALKAYRETLTEDWLIEFMHLDPVFIDWDTENFVEVKNGKISVGLDVPIGLGISGLKDQMHRLGEILKSMLKGNVIIVLDDCELFSFLEKAHLPVIMACDECKVNFRDLSQIIYTTKDVWTNFGTIFAN